MQPSDYQTQKPWVYESGESMKSRSVSSKSVSVLMSVALLSCLTACGGKFAAQTSLAGEPVVTSDPLVGAKARWKKAIENGDSEITFFDNAKDEEGFNKTMNGEDFDLEKYAEQIETRPDDIKTTEIPDADDELPEVETVNENEVIPEAAPTVKAGGPSTNSDAKSESTIVEKALPKSQSKPPESKTAEPKAESKPESKSESKAESKTELRDYAEGKVKKDAQPEAKPKAKPHFKTLAIPKFAKDICETTNIKSSAKENLDHLYNDKTPLPSNLPAEELKAMDSRKKQNQFICLLIPHALRMNAVVFNQRIYVARMQYRHSKGIMKDADKAWVAKMKEAYKLEADASFEELLKRVDIVPLPMLLTQAAVESGWGTSRAVREVRNLFGMHGNKGDANCKMGFEKDGQSCLIVFPTITASVAQYIRLLNRAKPYEKFRTIRAQMRKANKALDSAVLFTGLEQYSERGQAYIANLKTIMSEHNKINKYELNETKMAEGAVPVGAGSTAAAFAPPVH
jgi:Bax protein